jgi:hypothetical protein
MLPKEVGHLGVEILNAARRWAQARARMRLVLDSKTATPSQTEQVRAAYNKASHELEVLVVRLERVLLLSGAVVPASRQRGKPIVASPVLQGLLVNIARAGAQALHETLNPGQKTEVKEVVAEVIDMKE